MKKLMYIAAALLVLVGCQKKENVIENTPQNLVTITGGIDFSAQDGPNKVAVNGDWVSATSGSTIDFVWETGDKIAILNTKGTEIKKFTVSEISQDGKSATFTGEALSSGMESYYAIYPYEYGEAFSGDIKSFFANQQYSEDLKPYIVGFGGNDSFSMDIFSAIIDLSLTGSVKLGKIVYHLDEAYPQDAYDATLSFGNEGFQLTDQPQHVTFTPYNIRSTGFTLNFYDTDNNLIMPKKSKTNLTSVSTNYIASFPTLEVKAAAQTVDPKSIFTDKAAMKICFYDTSEGECSFTYVYHTDNTTFIVSEIIVGGVDYTESVKNLFSVVKGEGNKFTFHYPNEKSYVNFDADATPATWIFSANGFQQTTLTHLYVNGVDIIDQIKVTNLSKQK